MNNVFLITDEELKRDDVKRNIDLGHIKYVGKAEKKIEPEVMLSEPIEKVEVIPEQKSEEESEEESKEESEEEPEEESEEAEEVGEEKKKKSNRDKKKNKT
jgi:hypothetical protein